MGRSDYTIDETRAGMCRGGRISSFFGFLIMASVVPIWSLGGASSEIRALLAELHELVEIPLPELPETEVEKLAAGRIVTVLLPAPEKERESYRALAAVVTRHSRTTLWIALQDPHFATGVGGFRALELVPEGGRSCWYGFLDLPFPLADRHWVVDVWDNVKLPLSTSGAAWEHVWKERPQRIDEALKSIAEGSIEGLDTAQVAAAILVPINRGSWAAAELQKGRTLLVFQASISIGGLVPEWIVARFARRNLRRLLARVMQLAAEVPEHYSGDHALLSGGDGRPMPLFSR